MGRKKVFLMLLAAVCILLAVMLAAGAVVICRDGLVRQAEVYTDSLNIHDTKAIAQRLQDIPFDETEIRQILEEYADR